MDTDRYIMGISTGDELQMLLTMRKKFKNSEPACLKRKGGLLMKNWLLCS